ncbi:hypothetical protein [Catellatospora vulcania]|uniref:hypothetical protein n=1 Tax=Catellatospora vulcania TaxID=1460450 RepID=UPI0012D386C3|nr:hypothetical protein [Catellatospora vulcania]
MGYDESAVIGVLGGGYGEPPVRVADLEEAARRAAIRRASVREPVPAEPAPAEPAPAEATALREERPTGDST